jgi:UPF0755 protein
VTILAVLVIILGVIIYRKFYTNNVSVPVASKEFLYIPTGSSFEDLVEILNEKKLLVNEASFRWTAKQLKYDKNVKPGRYKLKPKMNNKELVGLLRSGRQEPVQVIFNNIRTREQFAQRIGEQIEVKPQALLNLMNDSVYTSKIGFSPDNILSLFIPNTYEFYWNTSADKFLIRMKKEYDKFWTPQRLAQAKRINFTSQQISVIASIIQLETTKEDEKPIIAGVYINRLRKDWKLEADPTLVFAMGDFTISRVLNIYKELDSPYNTYMYHGLPPGPICLPTAKSINAVLNHVSHNYMFFCARDDFSGYHTFSVNFETHLKNARKYQKALDRRGIRS